MPCSAESIVSRNKKTLLVRLAVCIKTLLAAHIVLIDNGALLNIKALPLRLAAGIVFNIIDRTVKMRCAHCLVLIV